MRNKYCYFCKIISQKTESKLLRVKFSNDRALIPCNDNNDLGTWACSDCIEAFNSYMVRHTVEKAVFNEAVCLNLVRYEALPYYDHIYELLFGVKYSES